MIYHYIGRRNAHLFELTLKSDLAARQMAAQATDCMCVKTDGGRVVWRADVDTRMVNRPLKPSKYINDLQMVEWFDRAKESK